MELFRFKFLALLIFCIAFGVLVILSTKKYVYGESFLNPGSDKMKPVGTYSKSNEMKSVGTYSGGLRDPGGYFENKQTKRKCVVIDVRKPNDANYECVVTKTDPPYTVCIYDTKKDTEISRYLKQYGAWEGKYIPTVTTMLKKFPNLGFIDIGANLGVYGLLAATMGHKTVVVEPWPEHISHIHKSAKVGKLEDKLTIVQNAIADKYENFTAVFAYGSGNKGALRMAPYKGQGPLMQSVLMDDLLEVIDFNVAIMKIDAEGFEDKAFKNSTRFFGKIFIPYILMEWAFPLHVYRKDTARVEGLISTMTNRGYQPCVYTYKPPYHLNALNIKQWGNWPLDIVWRHVLVGAL